MKLFLIGIMLHLALLRVVAYITDFGAISPLASEIYYLATFAWLGGIALILASRKWEHATIYLILASQLPMYKICLTGVAGSGEIIPIILLATALGTAILGAKRL